MTRPHSRTPRSTLLATTLLLLGLAAYFPAPAQALEVCFQPDPTPTQPCYIGVGTVCQSDLDCVTVIGDYCGGGTGVMAYASYFGTYADASTCTQKVCYQSDTIWPVAYDCIP